MFHIAVQQQQRLGCIGLSLLLLSVSNEWLLPWLLAMWAQSVRQAGRHGGGACCGGTVCSFLLLSTHL